MSNIKEAGSEATFRDINWGGLIRGGGTSLGVKTGDWRVLIPSWNEEKCKHCMLCFPTCADSAIPVRDAKRFDFDFMHCKGCGVCYKVCPFGAITFEKEDK